VGEMHALSRYLISQLVLDFKADVDRGVINQLLIEDASPLARDLRSRLAAQGGPDDFLLVLADCLREHLREGINEEQVLDSILMYIEA